MYPALVDALPNQGSPTNVSGESDDLGQSSRGWASHREEWQTHTAEPGATAQDLLSKRQLKTGVISRSYHNSLLPISKLSTEILVLIMGLCVVPRSIIAEALPQSLLGV